MASCCPRYALLIALAALLLTAGSGCGGDGAADGPRPSPDTTDETSSDDVPSPEDTDDPLDVDGSEQDAENDSQDVLPPDGDTEDPTPDGDPLDPPTDADGDSARVVVTPGEGGVLQLDGVTLVVPPGAVAAPTEVRLEVLTGPPVPLPERWSAATPVARLTPHGLTLLTPATLTLAIAEEDPSPLRHLRLADDEAVAWEDLGAVSPSGAGVSLLLSAFSLHGVGRDNPNCRQTCGARTCGVDPTCGRSCGSCSFGQVCDPTGQCTAPSTCEPQCDDAVCGPDACGGVCGTCFTLGGPPQACGSGACHASYSIFELVCPGLPFGAIYPMPGTCGARTYRSPFNAPQGELEIEWSWAPPNALDFSTDALFAPVLDATGTLYVANSRAAWAVTRGRTLWQHDVDGSFGAVVSSPVSYGGRVFVTTANGHMLALSTQTGALLWHQRISDQQLTPGSDRTPVIAADDITVQGETALLTYDFDGSLLRSLPLYNEQTTGPIARGGDGVLFRMHQDHAVATDAASGEDLWSAWAPAAVFTHGTFLADGIILYPHAEDLFLSRTFLSWRRASDGELVRRLELEATFLPRLALAASGHALVVSGNASDATHRFLQTTTGEETGTFTTDVGVRSHPVATRANGLFLVVDGDGNVYVVDYFGTIWRKVALPSSSRPLDDRWTARTPVLGPDGRIFVAFGAGGGRLYALRQRP